MGAGGKIQAAGEGMAIFKHLVKNLLHKVFTALPVISHVKQETIQLAIVPLKEQAHLIQVPGFHPEHDRIIGQRVQSNYYLLLICTGNSQKIKWLQEIYDLLN